jgi:DNA-binding CsgD family transcriptional regulator
MPNKVVEDLRERLAAIREATRAQHRARSEVLDRIRRSLADLAAQRSRLRGRRQAPPARNPLQILSARFGFTAREAEVAMRLAEGASNASIAQALGISEHTARHHTRHVLTKLGVHSRAQAGALVLRGIREGDTKSV